MIKKSWFGPRINIFNLKVLNLAIIRHCHYTSNRNAVSEYPLLPFWPVPTGVWGRALCCTSTPKRWIIRAWMSSQDALVDRETEKKIENNPSNRVQWNCWNFNEKKKSWNRRHLDLTDSDSSRAGEAGCNFVCNPFESMAAAWDTLARAKVKCHGTWPLPGWPFPRALGLWSGECWKVLKFDEIVEVLDIKCLTSWSLIYWTGR